MAADRGRDWRAVACRRALELWQLRERLGAGQGAARALRAEVDLLRRAREAGATRLDVRQAPEVVRDWGEGVAEGEWRALACRREAEVGQLREQLGEQDEAVRVLRAEVAVLRREVWGGEEAGT